MHDQKDTNEIDHLQLLCEALLEIRSTEMLSAFLKDLCTPSEIRAISERWHVATLLDQNKYSYREINKLTGVSTTTIGRVARFMTQEPHQGYVYVLKQQKKKISNAS